MVSVKTAEVDVTYTAYNAQKVALAILGNDQLCPKELKEFFTPEQIELKKSFVAEYEKLGFPIKESTPTVNGLLVNNSKALDSLKYLVRQKQTIELIEKAIANGYTQFVNYGCGLDETYFYLSQKHKKIQFYEADLQGIVDSKKDFLNKILVAGTASKNYHITDLDLEACPVHQVTDKVGFDENKKSFISFIGLTPHLNPEKSMRLIKTLASGMKRDSVLYFNFVSSEGALNIGQKTHAESGEVVALLKNEKLFTFGINDMKAMVKNAVNKSFRYKNSDFAQISQSNFVLAVKSNMPMTHANKLHTFGKMEKIFGKFGSNQLDLF